MKLPYLTHFRCAALAWACLSVLAGSLPSDAAAFRIYTDAPGVIRVDHAALVAAGVETTELPSEALALLHLGEPVPIWIEDGGDGKFGDGDHLEFVAGHLPGEHGYYHEHSRHNVFWLHTDASDGARMTRQETTSDTGGDPQPLRRTLHLERDSLLLRLSGHEIERSGDAELWYWAKLTHIDREPFAIELDLPDAAAGPARLRAGFRGLSLPRHRRATVPDHVVEISIDGVLVGTAEWGGRDVHEVDLEIDSKLLGGESRRLEMHVPKRTPEGDKDPLVDALALNWIAIDFPSSGVWSGGMPRFQAPDPATDRVLELATAAERPVVYSSLGERIEPARSAKSSAMSFETKLRFRTTGAQWYQAADLDALRAPIRIELDRPSDLRSTDRGADYLMIAHASLLEAIEPLASFHRERDLEVAVIDIQDVYDEFNHGVLDPRAIHDFVSHAYHSWSLLQPRFVLLVGDASWDTKHETVDDANYANWTQNQLFRGDRFVARNTPVVPENVNRRNLVPTWNYHSGHGHSASDNFFVSVEGEDFLPDLAIGRFPVTEPEEVAAIVDKTIRYVSEPPVGPWRRDVLWITNDHPSFQRRSDQIAAHLDDRGYGAVKVYPEASELSNERHQASLLEAFDQGTSLVHFYGHGGRHIWRTGPPDFKKNHDLFTLDHIDELEPHDRLPLVLSMTCFSAPFDHPNADSIGEKFVRVADRGAIAVLAASWRNSPSPSFSRALVDHLLVPGEPIGTAIQEAKRKVSNRNLIETYNLLGDPAIPLAIPAGKIELQAVETAPASVTATFEPADFEGQALIEWLDEAGAVLDTSSTTISQSQLRWSFNGTGSPERFRIYAWNEDTGIDAAGSLALPTSEDQTADLGDSAGGTP